MVVIQLSYSNVPKCLCRADVVQLAVILSCTNKIEPRYHNNVTGHTLHILDFADACVLSGTHTPHNNII